jgi:ribosomal protein S12 methylthiotransferase
MEERRNELLAVQETVAAAKNIERIGSTLEVMVDGPGEEGNWLEGRHEGLAPEIDGVVYINGSDNREKVPNPGDCVRVRITDATTYDLTGHIQGEASVGRVATPERQGPRGGYR